ncbi:MAG: Gldg family protein [Candidatus Omnitrophota bacterium]|jgi:ABC-2 type transport system permease protein
MNRIQKVLMIFSKEMAGYFNSSIAYIFLIIFTLLNGGLFMTQFFMIGRADMRSFFYGLPMLLCIFLPAVSMRLWAEEKRGNTQELLLTFPMAPHELVLGKFLASFCFYLLALACTVPVPLMLMILGQPDLGPILGGYIGAAVLGSFFLAIGILVSGFCRDQIVAFILSMMICFGFYLVGTDFVAVSIDGWVAGLGSFLRQMLGAADHFGAFSKGVVDNRDLLYFALGTAVCLVLNGFWIEGRMRPKAGSIFATAAVMCTAIFLVSNWLVLGIPLGRFDLTKGKVYTISQPTRKILRELKSPVMAKFYVSSSEKMPTALKTLEQDVRDKLDEIRIASEGRFQYKVYPMDVSEIVAKAAREENSAEEQLAKKGIEPFQVESVQSDEMGVKLVYSAISLSYKEKPDEILPSVHPGNLDELEYALVSKIYRMSLDEIPGIAMVAPAETRGVDPNLRALLEQLGAGDQLQQSFRDDPYEALENGLRYDGYRVERIDLTEGSPIPPGTKALALIAPERLSERQKYEINKFIVQGGSVFVAVQQREFNYRPMANDVELIATDKDPQINDLLVAWGLKVDTRVLADEQSEIVNVSAGRMGLFETQFPVRLPIQTVLTPAEMNLKVSITSRLPAFFYLWGSAIALDQKKIEAQGLSVETLLSSSKDSWMVPFKPQGMTARDLLQEATSPQGPFPLAVLVQGQFANAFEKIEKVPAWESEDLPGEETVPEKKDEGEAPQALVSAPGKMILIGAATPFQRQLIRGGGHMAFFMNAMDVLTLGDDLVGIRTKSVATRALPKVSREAKLFWRFFGTLFMPALIAVAGFLHFYFRSRTRQAYLKSIT